MAAIADDKLARIIGSGLIIYESFVDELVALLKEQFVKVVNVSDLLMVARRAIEAFEPLLAQSLTDTEVAAWVLASTDVAATVPMDVLDTLSGRFPWETAGKSGGKISAPPAPSLQGIGGDGDEILSNIIQGPPPAQPIIRFPAIETAAADLLARQVVTRPQFDAMTTEARSRAFTVARIAATDSIAAVRDAVLDAVKEGGTLEDFKEQAYDALSESAISPWHAETVFRVNVQTAYTLGQQAIVQNPVIGPVFPYARLDAIHDSRVRPEHLALETMGLDSTNVFRSDDAIWQIITPPIDFNCILPGQRLSARNVQLGFRSFYEGAVIEIKTDSGNVVRITPNHGVLTDKGVVQARFIQEGDNILRHGERAERDRPVLGQHVHNKPPLVEDVFRSLAEDGPTLRAPAGPLAFYGDAKRFKHRHVDVVGPLLLAMYRKFQFRVAAKILQRDINRNIVARNLSAVRPNGLHDLAAIIRGNLRPSVCESFGACSGMDTSLHEPRVYGFPGDVQFGGDLTNGHPLLMTGNDFGIWNADRKVRSRRREREASGEHLVSHARVGNSLAGSYFGNGHSSDIHGNAFFSGNGMSDSLAAKRSMTVSSLAEQSSYGANGNPEFLGDLFHRHAGIVKFDKVASVRKFDFSGHVYDFQTSTGWLGVEGILLRQCRCAKTFLTVRQAARRGVQEAIQWLETGHPPALPQYVGPIFAWPASGFKGPGARLTNLAAGIAA